MSGHELEPTATHPGVSLPQWNASADMGGQILHLNLHIHTHSLPPPEWPAKSADQHPWLVLPLALANYLDI